jgi:hypothetical protein
VILEFLLLRVLVRWVLCIPLLRMPSASCAGIA